MFSLKFGLADEPRDEGSSLARHVLAYDRDGLPSVYGWRREDELGVEVPEVATFRLPAGAASLTVIPEALVASEAVLDAYYGMALPLAVQASRDLEVLHGSAVLLPSASSAAAFCGMTESGKSTAAYGLAQRGYRQWADDAVSFRIEDSQPVTTVGMPFTVKLRESSSAYFGLSSEPFEVVDEFQWQQARLAAIFLLEPRQQGEREGRPVAVERLAPAEALGALLPHAFRFQPQAHTRRQETMGSYLDLVASVPILATRYPDDLDRLPELLDELERWIHDVR